MSELIKREDAIKITWQEPQYYDPINALTEVREKIRALPTVDAVPVVRCRECDSWDEEYSSGRKSLGNYRCICHEWSDEEDGHYRYTAEDDFCSHGCADGERRTE